MRKEKDHVEEEYVYVADVTHDAVLISWGKFFFNSKWKLIPDKDLHLFDGHYGRHSSIGERCDSYGTATVRVFDADGNEKATTTDKSYAWIRGLKANTEYTYRIVVPEGSEARDWGGDPLYRYDKEGKELHPTARPYDCRFRTFPAPDVDAPLTFAVIGDTGTGGDVQQDVAEALELMIEEHNVRLIILLGDVIYNRSSGGSGDNDFEWLTTYFQPYRHIISRVPVFPCMGNHDTKENWLHGVFLGEKQGDRLAVYDNLLVTPRFVNANEGTNLPPAPPPGRQASVGPGLFYRFNFGSSIEFICLDTSKEPHFDRRLFENENHNKWVRAALTEPLGSPRWRIPFSHHPPYCKGPVHNEDETNLRHEVIQLCEQNGIRAFLSGHEHNFQCIDSHDIQGPNADRNVRCFITGGAGDFRSKRLDEATDGYLHRWGGNDRGHFLIVTISGNEMTVKPFGCKREGAKLDINPLPLFDILDLKGKTPVSEAPILVSLPNLL